MTDKHVGCLEQQSEIQRNHIVTMEQDLTAALTTMKKEIIEKQEAEESHMLARKEIKRNDGFISPAITKAGHGAADSCSSGKARGC